jgi:hypothetical protein
MYPSNSPAFTYNIAITRTRAMSREFSIAKAIFTASLMGEKNWMQSASEPYSTVKW